MPSNVVLFLPMLSVGNKLWRRYKGCNSYVVRKGHIWCCHCRCFGHWNSKHKVFWSLYWFHFFSKHGSLVSWGIWVLFSKFNTCNFKWHHSHSACCIFKEYEKIREDAADNHVKDLENEGLFSLLDRIPQIGQTKVFLCFHSRSFHYLQFLFLLLVFVYFEFN